MPSHDGSPLLEARGLQRSFGRVRILRGLDLSLQEGEALAVVGPNGAGKTTLLRILAGLMRPTAGQIQVLGQPLDRTARPQTRAAIGLLSHQSLLYDDLTLLENLTFTARLYGSGPAARGGGSRAGPGGTRGSGRRAAEAAEPGPSAAGGDRAGRCCTGRSCCCWMSPLPRWMRPRPTGFGPSCERGWRQGLGVVLVTHHLTEAWELATRGGGIGQWVLGCRRAAYGTLDAFLPRYHGLIGA